MDLFAEDEAFDLPALIYGPIKMPVGRIEALLRPAESVTLQHDGSEQVSARGVAPVYKHPNGERYLVANRGNIVPPPGIDGVLVRTPAGLKWLRHKQLDELQSETNWGDAIRTRAAKWDTKFQYRAEQPNEDGSVDLGKEGLRPPQIGALHAIGAHWSLHHSPATVVMPTGTGKTETMLATLAIYVRDPLLVVVPSDPLRKQTLGKFLDFGKLRELGVLAADIPNPIVGLVKSVPKSTADLEIFERCNVIIATMASVAGPGAEQLAPEIADRVGALIVDEAHHIGADTWSRFREAFVGKPVLQFTATPFRRDGKLVDGQVIFNYPLQRAQKDGYFKPIVFDPVFEFDPREADVAIASQAVERLREDLGKNLNHMMMARCDSIDRATAVHDIYRKIAPDLNPLLVHSRDRDADKRIEQLKAGASRVAVCVNMLGEGFDLPQLKVAAIHDLHQSLAVLLQFTGRFTRSAGQNIGDATVVANIAEANVSTALERLYSEDADWNQLLSEMSSDAAKQHARLVAFLDEAQRLDRGPDDDETAISHHLLKPKLSTLTYRAEGFSPKKFHEGLSAELVPYRVWLHNPSNTLFFVTKSEPTIQWIRSKAVRDTIWTLFVLHYEAARKLLYLHSSDTKSFYEPLARAVGATALVNEDIIFRSLGRISRLIFHNVGVRKYGRRNLSYASYTGSDVAAALGLTEKSNSVKAMLQGQGWEGGRQILFGCSRKGRVWSKEQAPIPQLTDWCENLGSKLLDDSIDTSELIQHVLIPTEITELPDTELLGIDWPLELLRQTEERIVFTAGKSQVTMTTCELVLLGKDQAAKAIDFALDEAVAGRLGTFRVKLDEVRGYRVIQTSAGLKITITIGKFNSTLEDYFSDYAPVVRLVDLSDLEGNLHIAPQSPYDLNIAEDRFEAWTWKGVDRTKESYWKNGKGREDSIQWHVAQEFIKGSFEIVFDDDASGEAADLVCMKEEDDAIRVAFIHCKFSGGAEAGERVKDVVEVSSQAVRCAKWGGKFAQLCQHIKLRNEKLRQDRPSRFLAGNPSDLNRLVKLSRFKPMRIEVLIVQPGLSQKARSKDQSMVLAAAMTYLRDTIDVELKVVCDE